MNEIKKMVYCSVCKQYVPSDKAVDLGAEYNCKECFEKGVEKANYYRNKRKEQK